MRKSRQRYYNALLFRYVYKCRLAMLFTLASNAGLFIGVLVVKNGFSSIYSAVSQPRLCTCPPTLTYASQRSMKNSRIPSSFLTSCRRMNLTVRPSARALWRLRLTSRGYECGHGPLVVPVDALQIPARCQLRPRAAGGRTARLCPR